MAGTAALIALVVGFVGVRGGGLASYAIDDAYIHLAVARALGRHGTWGVVPGAYESASSSMGWILLLAPFSWLPGMAWVPLVANLASGAWLLWQIAALTGFQRIATMSGSVARFVPMLYPIAVGLVPLMFTGMEHTLHAAVVVAVLVSAGAVASGEEPPSRRSAAAVLVGLAVGSLLRPETVFVAAGIVVALWTSARSVYPAAGRRTLASLVVVAASTVPLAGWAAINLGFGQGPAPNSIAAKTALHNLGSGVAQDLVDNVGSDLLLVAVVGVAIAVLLRRPGRGASAQLVTMLVATSAHLLLADVGWMDRYQAYLIVGLSVGIIEGLPNVVGRERLPSAMAIGMALLMTPRLALAVNTPLAMHNVAHMQAQMGAVLADVAPARAVAVNDLGWVAWRHDGPVIDVAGLGSHEILELRRNGALDRDAVASILEREEATAMVVYDLFDRLVPADWVPVATTCVDERAFVLTDPCVHWYAPDADAAARLDEAIARHAQTWDGAMTVRRPADG